MIISKKETKTGWNCRWGETTFTITKRRYYNVLCGLARNLYAIISIFFSGITGGIAGNIAGGYYPTPLTSMSFVVFSLITMTVLTCLFYGCVILLCNDNFEDWNKRREKRKKRRK